MVNKMNKKGWIEILEAFIAMLLITAVILILLNKGYSDEEDISGRIYDIEVSILREIQFNNTLRGQILQVDTASLPIRWDSEEFPDDLRDKIMNRTPESVTCIGAICDPSTNCIIDGLGKRDVYVQSVIISPTPGNPIEVWMRLKLFCYS
jgi:hypothetical protein